MNVNIWKNISPSTSVFIAKTNCDVDDDDVFWTFSPPAAVAMTTTRTAAALRTWCSSSWEFLDSFSLNKHKKRSSCQKVQIIVRVLVRRITSVESGMLNRTDRWSYKPNQTKPRTRSSTTASSRKFCIESFAVDIQMQLLSFVRRFVNSSFHDFTFADWGRSCIPRDSGGLLGCHWLDKQLANTHAADRNSLLYVRHFRL